MVELTSHAPGERQIFIQTEVSRGSMACGGGSDTSPLRAYSPHHASFESGRGAVGHYFTSPDAQERNARGSSPVADKWR
jgi:hypothetical protein